MDKFPSQNIVNKFCSVDEFMYLKVLVTKHSHKISVVRYIYKRGNGSATKEKN